MPFAFNSSSSAARRSPRRPVMMMLYPISANLVAVAFPIPEVAPVINAILFIVIIV